MTLRAAALYLALAAAVVAVGELFFHHVLGWGRLTIGGIIGGVLVIVVVDALMGDLPRDREHDGDGE